MGMFHAQSWAIFCLFGGSMGIFAVVWKTLGGMGIVIAKIDLKILN